jgi:hypothetical protein
MRLSAQIFTSEEEAYTKTIAALAFQHPPELPVQRSRRMSSHQARLAAYESRTGTGHPVVVDTHGSVADTGDGALRLIVA